MKHMLGITVMPILETPATTSTAVVKTEPQATPKSAINTTPATAMTTLTLVFTTPVVTTVVPLTTTPSPTTKAELAIGIFHDILSESSNFSKPINVFLPARTLSISLYLNFHIGD